MAYDAALGYDPANIMKSINDAVAKGDDAEVERLSVERYKRLQADPALMSKYGTDPASQIAQNVLRRKPPVDTTVGGALTSQPSPSYPTYPTAPAVAPSTNTGSGTYNNFSDVMAWVDTLNAKRAEGAINQLGQARDKSLSSLTAERGALAPAYYDSRNQISSQGSQAQAGMDEYLAQAGLAGSGAQGALQTRLVGQTQGALGASQTSEAKAIADILRRQQGVEQDYQYGVANANNQSEADRIQQQIDAANTQRDYDLQAANYTGTLNGSPTMQNLQYQQNQLDAAYQREVAQYQSQQDQTNYDTQVGLQSAPYTGMLNGQATVQATAAADARVEAAHQAELDTIDRFSANFQSEINKRKGTADTSDDWMVPYLETSRTAKIAAQASTASAQAQDTYDKAMQTFEQIGVASGWVAQSLGLPEGTKSMDYLTTLKTINKPYYNPNTGRSSGGGSSGGSGGSSAGKASVKAPVNPIKRTTANTEIKELISVGSIPDSEVSSTTEQAYARLAGWVDSGAITEEDADVIIQKNPALKTYVTAKITAANSRTASQTR